MYLFEKKNIIIAGLAIIVLGGIFLTYNTQPANLNSPASSMVFEISEGQGFRTIVGDLSSERLIRSRTAFEFLAVFEGRAWELKPGLYQLDSSMSSQEILSTLTNAADRAVSATIPEGSNIYEIDAILAKALVIRPGDLVSFKDDGNLEGKLFPDTYDFFPGSNIKDVVQKFLNTFQEKAVPILNADPMHAQTNLIIASLLEKEVRGQADQEMVAGIIKKRLAAGMPLDIDATLCYAKLIADPTSTNGCYPITFQDEKIASPYNTYLYKGLPPAPIGNPGVAAITAAIHPTNSPYWYYLSDPKTGKTVYAVTLSGQEANIKKYLQ